MYLLIVVIVYLLFAIKFVDWKHWKDYYPTIQFYTVNNLLYNFIFYQHTLWEYKAITVPWLNHTIIDLVFTFFIIPVVIMIYLRFFPEGNKKYLYVAGWSAYFAFIEFIFYKRGLFAYDNGWGMGWSALFDVIMFVLIRIHYKNSLLAMLIAIPIIGVLFILFHPLLHELK